MFLPAGVNSTEAGMKAIKRVMKMYNVHANSQPSDYLPNRLEEEFEKRRREQESVLDRGYATRAVRRLRAGALTKTSVLAKQAVQFDSLGKQTSPATQGGSVEAPMPQTEYAKGTLNNEYANRLNKKQLAEMNKLRQQQNQNSSDQSSNSSTTTNSTSATTTTTSLTNSGLMASLSIGSVM